MAKRQTKAIAAIATTAACVITAGVLAGCGETKTDWTTYKYPDFEAISLTDWEAKEVAYQFSGDDYDEANTSSWAVLINLNADGSLVYLQGLIFKAHPDSWNWAIDEMNVRWINYGYWETDEDSNLVMHYTHWYPTDPDFTDNGEPFDEEFKDVWIETTIYAESDGTYTIENGDLTRWFMGAGTNGGNQDALGAAIKGDGSVTYNTFSAWYDSWKHLIPTGSDDNGPPASDSDKE